jgi:hypothetical protein
LAGLEFCQLTCQRGELGVGLVEHRLEGEAFCEAAALDVLQSALLPGFLGAPFADLVILLDTGHVLPDPLDGEQQVFLAFRLGSFRGVQS